MGENQNLDVIAVGAHPDDVEISCGGTLAHLVDLGYRVGIVDLTDGEPTPGCPDPSVRRAEATAAAKALGVHLREVLGFTNRCLFDNLETRLALATIFRRHRPRLVLGFGAKTPLASPDHGQAVLITDAAIFYSRLTKWDDRFAGLPPHTIPHYCYYRIAFEETLPLTSSEFVMDITQSLARKMQAIRCYKSQFPPAKNYVFERVEAIARYSGGLAGFGAGEVFCSPKAIGTRDIIKFWEKEEKG